MTVSLPPGGPDLTFVYQVILGMDQKLDRLIETFATVREHSELKARVDKLEERWRPNLASIIAALSLIATIAYSIAYFILK